MESEQFLYTKFKIFGLLTEGNQEAVEVNTFQEFVKTEEIQQEKLARAIPTTPNTESVSPRIFREGEKKFTAILPCFHQVSISEPIPDTTAYQFMVKVHYDDFQYKTIVIFPETTPMELCAALASKLNLDRFTFRLYIIQNQQELHCIPEDESISEFIEKMKIETEKEPDIRFQVLRPKPTGVNTSMRALVLCRWLNYKLRGSYIVKNLKTDLASGKVLCLLAEQLSEGLTPQISADSTPTQILSASFRTLSSIGIEIPREHAIQQILSGSKKKICSVLWSILYRYCIAMKSLDSINQQKSTQVSEFIFLEELYTWCGQLLQAHPEIEFHDFNKSWRDGLAIAAVLENFDNYRISYTTIKDMESIPERLEGLFYALGKWFELPSLITPKELLLPPSEIDDMAIIIFLTVATLHLHAKQQTKTRRTSLVSTVPVLCGQVPTRVYIEGIEGISHKVFLFNKETIFGDIRRHISTKMELSTDSFWICVIENEMERLPPDDEEVTLDSSISITIKMVSGSSYYNKEALTPTLPRRTKTAARLVQGRQRSVSDPLLKRTSSFFRRMKRNQEKNKD